MDPRVPGPGEASGRWPRQVAGIDLPLLDEPNHPRLRQYQNQHTKDWSAIVDAADAIVIVTPEYNYGYPAAVKNAIDYLHKEWAYKPVGFVSYGGIATNWAAPRRRCAHCAVNPVAG